MADPVLRQAVDAIRVTEPEGSTLREKVRRVSEEFPDATNAQLMEMLGVSRNTVQRYRMKRHGQGSGASDVPRETSEGGTE